MQILNYGFHNMEALLQNHKIGLGQKWKWNQINPLMTGNGHQGLVIRKVRVLSIWTFSPLAISQVARLTFSQCQSWTSATGNADSASNPVLGSALHVSAFQFPKSVHQKGRPGTAKLPKYVQLWYGFKKNCRYPIKTTQHGKQLETETPICYAGKWH